MAEEDEPKGCEWCNVTIDDERDLCLNCDEAMRQADAGEGIDWDQSDRDYWASLESGIDDAESDDG